MCDEAAIVTRLLEALRERRDELLDELRAENARLKARVQEREAGLRATKRWHQQVKAKRDGRG